MATALLAIYYIYIYIYFFYRFVIPFLSALSTTTFYPLGNDMLVGHFINR